MCRLRYGRMPALRQGEAAARRALPDAGRKPAPAAREA
jgi:hypothetical protein